MKTRTVFYYLLLIISLNSTCNANDFKPKLFKELDTLALQKLITQRRDLMLIDVRTPDEIATLGGTIDAGYRNYNIPRGWLEFQIEDFVSDKNTPIVMLCGISARSPLAAETLTEMGYTKVYNYSDGFFKWRDAGLPVRLKDGNPHSILFSQPIKVADGVWSAIGETAPPTYENSGHNNNLSFIITDDGVVVINAGASYLLAQALHAEIKLHTDQPVRFVTLENGQGHAMLGSHYWQAQGAKIVAHIDTAHEIEAYGADVIASMKNRQRDKSMGTELTRPDITFTEKYTLDLGGERIELLNLGPAHSPGDIVVWLPDRKIVIAGDIAFHQRLLPVFEETDTRGWINTWQHFKALGADIIVPGHGEPTTLNEVEKYTYDYLTFLRGKVSELIEMDGTLQDAYQIDQSAYAHLDTFDELAKRNAERVFREMEFE